MKNLSRITLSIFATLLLCSNINAQTKTPNKQITKFYDYAKTQVKEVYFVNSLGQKNGLYKAYTENGVLSVEVNFVNNVMNGSGKEYYTFGDLTLQGIVKTTATFKNNEKNGLKTTYDYFYNGQSMSEQRSWESMAEWAQNGKKYKFSEEYYISNRKDSIRIYYPNGKLRMKSSYTYAGLTDDNTPKIFAYTISYNENGKPQSEGKFIVVNGVQNAIEDGQYIPVMTWKFYKEDGTFDREEDKGVPPQYAKLLTK